MNSNFTEEKYEEMLSELFQRFPSFQKNGVGAYKPGIANMEFFDQLAGHPHDGYKIIHVAGTNGKGSVSNMLASVLAACGMKVGLYTSPHISDFRERMRIIRPGSEESSLQYVPKQYVWDFVQKWGDAFGHLDLSFFEITTMMGLCWFADSNVDVVVLETGLGGRLDSTNIVMPLLSVITNIGLDHCNLLGDTLGEIAFEKAGIIKPGVPVVVGESSPETDAVFERKVLYTNLPDPHFMGNRDAIMSLLTFADKVQPSLWESHEQLLEDMDLRGAYQRKNLRTVLAAVDVLKRLPLTSEALSGEERQQCIRTAIVHTAARMEFHGRWQKLSDTPHTICDIGHNAHGLEYNFNQLECMLNEGKYSHLIIVYGSVADKDVDSVLHLLPRNARMIFTKAQGRRALPAEVIRDRYIDYCTRTGVLCEDICCTSTVAEAVAMARETAASIISDDADACPLIYIGGSTYVVAEAAAIYRQWYDS